MVCDVRMLPPTCNQGLFYAPRKTKTHEGKPGSPCIHVMLLFFTALGILNVVLFFTGVLLDVQI